MAQPVLRSLTQGLSRLGGALARVPLPGPARWPVWSAFARAYGAHPEEAARDLGEFATFQAFFTRELAPGRRPLDRDPGAWVSPVDAMWLSHQRIADGGFLPVKGNWHGLDELLADAAAADTWREGAAATFYLRPGDYHRIHAPCDMHVRRLRHIPGVLLPVNAWGQRSPGLFCRNERLILEAETDQGAMAMLWVGALMVGSMATSHPALPAAPAGGRSMGLSAQVRRGEELGMFRFGSTVIVLTDRPALPRLDLPAEVRVGEAVIGFDPAAKEEEA